MGFWGYVSEGTALEVQQNGQSAAAREAKYLSIVTNTLDDDIAHHLVHLSDAHSIYKKVKLLLLGNAAAETLKIKKNIEELAFQGSYYWLSNNFIQLVGRLESLKATLDYKELFLQLLDKFPNSIAEFEKKIDTVMRYLVEKGIYRPIEKQNVFSVVARGKRCSECRLVHRAKEYPRCYNCNGTGYLRRNCPKLQSSSNNPTSSVQDDTGETATTKQHSGKFSFIPSALNSSVEPKESFVIDPGATYHFVKTKNCSLS
eukprot:augustus_masked-scaffold_4-processed-gene-3.58-mRNA-1 protein AED:1.00 eAED:1.00 QI:0/0/0/0/1/1/2/0/257